MKRLILTIILILGIICPTSLIASETLKVGETKTLYYPTEITGKTLAGQPAATSSRPDYVEVYSQDYSSVTIKAVKAFTGAPAVIHVTYHYRENFNGATYQRTGYYDYDIYVEDNNSGGSTTGDKPTGIALQPNSITIKENSSSIVYYSITPSTAQTTLSWGSENPSVASVLFLGDKAQILAHSKGTTRVYVQTDNGYKAYCSVTVNSTGEGNTDNSNTEYVDLGLSVKWAKCNLGASSPSGKGDYYAWGETKTKSTFTSEKSETQNVSDAVLKEKGYIDTNGCLTPEHDAATVKLGKNWRMPTKAEIEELVEKCRYELSTLNGVKGIKVTGANGNSIFLPFASRKVKDIGDTDNYCSLWTNQSWDGRDGAYCLSSSINSASFHIGADFRAFGNKIRPVYDARENQTINWSQEFATAKVSDVIELSATASSGLEVCYEITEGNQYAAIYGDLLICKGEGNVTITARQEGNDEYFAATPVSKKIQIVSANKQCQKPKISVIDGNLTIKSDTEGAKCFFEIVSEDTQKGVVENTDMICLTGQYYITAYTKADGYIDSEPANAILVWVNPSIYDPSDVLSMETKKAVVIRSTGNSLVVSGTERGERIELYSLGGTLLNSSVASDGETTIPCHLPKGEVVIVRYGDKSIKCKL